MENLGRRCCVYVLLNQNYRCMYIPWRKMTREILFFYKKIHSIGNNYFPKRSGQGGLTLLLYLHAHTYIVFSVKSFKVRSSIKKQFS